VATAEHNLRPLFEPRSIVLLGASTDATKLGSRALQNLKERFRGRYYAVHPRAGELGGLTTYPSVSALPEAPELAIVAVPASSVLEAVEACAAKGVRAAVLYSSGFAELGGKGAAMQARLAAIARQSGMRLLGPNCMGYLDVHGGTFASFSTETTHGGLVPGGVGIVSQSGAIGTLSLALVRERGLGISHWITTGNQCDVDFSECLAYLAEDDRTKVIVAGLEGCRDGEKFRAALRVAHARRKPVLMLKIGRSDVGAEAIVSHTGALAGNDAVYDAVFDAHGVYRGNSFTDVLDVAQVCVAGLYPSNGRLGIVTISGGVGVMMADEAIARGLDVARLPAAAQARLKEIMPLAGVRNPVDATTVLLTDPPLIRRFLDETLRSGDYGAVAVFLATFGLNRPGVERTLSALEGLEAAARGRPIVFVMAYTAETKALVEKAGYPVFDEPTRAIAAIAALHRIAEGWRRSVPKPPRRISAPSLPAAAINEHRALSALAEAGIPTVPSRLAAVRAEAERAAATFGYPVVLKVCSPDIAHKSEVGGVALDLGSRRNVGAAFDGIMAQVRKHAPRARLDGVLVAPMVRGGVETILGVQRDPVFGPVVMFGLGGIFVEQFKDVTIRLAPIGVAEAKRMIREVRGFPLLAGARGRAPMDVEALARAIAALSRLAYANAGTIESIDINPFVVLPEGAVALDALIVPRKREGR
jgi:acetate---CoA ligase (ADP-forming)